MPRAYTLAEVQKTVKEISSCELLSTEYTGVFDLLKFRCSCGREFEKSWDHFRYDRYRGCPTCARQAVGAKLRKPLIR